MLRLTDPADVEPAVLGLFDVLKRVGETLYRFSDTYTHKFHFMFASTWYPSAIAQNDLCRIFRGSSECR
ncbi:MAG: hypothetical protein ACJ789_01455 [Thermomicrobiales bacterium]